MRGVASLFCLCLVCISDAFRPPSTRGNVNKGINIFFPASTTVHAIIPYIKEHPELTVLTNSLRTAMAFFDSPHIQVILRGGYLRRESISNIGLMFEVMLSEMIIQTGFFGARGLSIENGLTDVNLDEVGVKRKIVKVCQQVVCMVDSRKWGKVTAYTFAGLDQIHKVIADKAASEDLVNQIKGHQMDVILVQVISSNYHSKELSFYINKTILYII